MKSTRDNDTAFDVEQHRPPVANVDLKLLFSALWEYVFSGGSCDIVTDRIHLIRQAFPDSYRVDSMMDHWEENVGAYMTFNNVSSKSFLFSGPGVTYAPTPKVNYERWHVLLKWYDQVPDEPSISVLRQKRIAKLDHPRAANQRRICDISSYTADAPPETPQRSTAEAHAAGRCPLILYEENAEDSPAPLAAHTADSLRGRQSLLLSYPPRSDELMQNLERTIECPTSTSRLASRTSNSEDLVFPSLEVLVAIIKRHKLKLIVEPPVLVLTKYRHENLLITILYDKNQNSCLGARDKLFQDRQNQLMRLRLSWKSQRSPLRQHMESEEADDVDSPRR